MGNYSFHKDKIREAISRRLPELELSRVDLSKALGKSLSYLSQVESGEVNCSDALADQYCKALMLDKESEAKFRLVVKASNARRKSPNKTAAGKSVSALMALAADQLSDDAISRIEEIVFKSVDVQ